MVSIEDVKKISQLAHIKLTEEEIEKYHKQFGNIIGYFDHVKTAKTEGVEYKSHVSSKNVFREDEVLPSLNREKILEQTTSKNGYIVVPSKG